MLMTPDENAVPGESPAGRLFAILSEQVSLARRGKLGEAMELAGEADQILSRANREQLEKIWSETPIRGLYDELCLMIAAAKSQAAGELAKTRNGKRTMRAYKDISRR